MENNLNKKKIIDFVAIFAREFLGAVALRKVVSML